MGNAEQVRRVLASGIILCISISFVTAHVTTWKEKCVICCTGENFCFHESHSLLTHSLPAEC